MTMKLVQKQGGLLIAPEGIEILQRQNVCRD